MQTFSFNLSNGDADLIYAEFKKFSIPNNNQYVLFIFKILNSTITVYKSMKIVIQTTNLHELLDFVSLNKRIYFLFKDNTTNKQTNNIERYEINEEDLLKQFDYVIGSDEVGVGDLFGGLVVCTVSLNEQSYQEVKKLKIDDSKKINDSKIIEVAKNLSKIVSYSIAELSPQKYNNLISEFHNSHILKTILHYDGFVSELNKKENVIRSFLILDQYVNEKKFNEYLNIANLKKLKINLFATKAESKYLCVAAASILARAHFLKRMKQMSLKFNIEFPLGASSDYINNIAFSFYKKEGIETFKKVAKEHFSNFKKIIS